MVSPEAVVNWTDEYLLDIAVQDMELLKWARERLALVETEIERRCRDRNASTMRSRKAIAEIKPGTPSYDSSRMVALAEILEPADFADAYTPEHQKTIDVPGSWHGGKVKKLVRQYGSEVAQVVEDATIPGKPRLKIEARGGYYEMEARGG